MATDTRDRILNSVLRVAGDFGLRKVSMRLVARDAGLTRQACYYYFDTRDEMVAAAILREEEAFLDQMVAATEGCADLEEALRTAIRTALTLAREHELLQRLLEIDPESLLPFLTTGRGPVLSAAEQVVRKLLAEWAPHLSDREVHRTAEATTRLIVSYAISPPEDDDVDEVAVELTALLLHGVQPSRTGR